jgi:hypothetical protein
MRVLGEAITRESVSISPVKLDTVQSWPVPIDKKEVESFLNYTNYHRENVQGYAGISKCLYELTGSKAKQFCRTTEHQEAFEHLKTALSSALCLAYSTPTDDFILDTDASDSTIAAELIQFQDRKEWAKTLQPVRCSILATVLMHGCHHPIDPFAGG